MPDVKASELPRITNETTEETVGHLFENWWEEQGEQKFVEYCQNRGLPVLDEQSELDKEIGRHDKFFQENV